MEIYVERKSVTHPLEREVVLDGIRNDNIVDFVADIKESIANMTVAVMKDIEYGACDAVYRNDLECLKELQDILTSHDFHKVGDTLVVSI